MSLDLFLRVVALVAGVALFVRPRPALDASSLPPGSAALQRDLSRYGGLFLAGVAAFAGDADLLERAIGSQLGHASVVVLVAAAWLVVVRARWRVLRGLRTGRGA